MSNTKYSDLLDDVLPSLAADPSDPVTEHAIKRTVIEFCASTWIWKHLPDPIDVVAGEAVYDLEPLPATDVATVMSVSLDGYMLFAKTTDWLDANEPGWRSVTGAPRYFTQVDTEQVILAQVPASSSAGGLTATLALQPSQNSTGFPKWIANQYLYALADGAIARLMLIPGKPWTDLNTGADKRSRFEAAMANARNTAVAGLGRAPTRTASQH